MVSPFPVFFIVAVLSACLHLYLKKEKRSMHLIFETFLLYQLIFSVGFNGIFNFIGHAFMGEQIADYIGWKAGSPFQLEVAFTNLTFGILGLFCIYFRGHFWTATVFGISIWYLCDAFGHIHDYITTGNDAPGNIGLPLYIDIGLPILLLLLLYLMHSNRIHKNTIRRFFGI